jgi:hypothetical protein
MTTSIGRIGSSLTSNPTVEITPTRTRQTPPPVISFDSLLRGGMSVLAAGARAASTLVGGPLLSAAVGSATNALSPSSATSALSTISAGSSVRVGADAASTSTSPSSSTDVDTARALQEQRSEDLKLLALQNEIQRHDRQISLVSNVMKARHDTAKAAIGNIRS